MMRLRCSLLPLGTMLVMVVAAMGAMSHRCDAQTDRDYVAGDLVTLNNNGAWSWFMDERAIVDRGKLIVGSVRAVGSFAEGQGDPDWGNVEVSVYDLSSGQVRKAVLARHFEQDDHDAPAFLVRPDGRYLAMFTKHAIERRVYYRISEHGNPLEWGEARTVQTPGADRRYAGDNATYSNLFRLPSGRVYDFHRGFSHDPNYLFSDDDGETWKYGGRLLQGRDGYSPYLKYACDTNGTIHFIATDDHPRNYDNSIYHGFLRDGQIYQSDGTPAARLSTTTDPSLAAWDLTRVFSGDADNVAWMVDIELDAQDQPYILFSVQKDGRGLPPRQGGMDLRYFYGRWNGSRWNVYEMAHAGRRLYPFEDDYSGLAALDPHDPNTVTISTDADPVTGEALISRADHRRHYELFRGQTSDGGRNWHWTPITANSTLDNLRPLIPRGDNPRCMLVWMRGTYTQNHGSWTTAVVAMASPTANRGE